MATGKDGQAHDPTSTLEARLTQQGAIAETALRALAGQSPESLMHEVAGRVATVLAVDDCMILELVPSGTALVLRASAAHGAGLPERTRFEAGPDWASLHEVPGDEARLLSDAAAAPWLRDSEVLRNEEAVTGISAVLRAPPGPLRAGPLGVLAAYSRKPRAFTRDETRFVQAMAGIVGAALARRRDEEALHRNAESLATTLYSIGDAVIATDEHGRIAHMNPVAERLTGWSERDAAGRPLSEIFKIVSEVTGLPAENPVDRVLGEGVIIGLANHTALISKDGTERPIADSGAPIRSPGGPVLGAVLVFRDVSEERRREQAARFIAEASALLSSDLDYATTLERIAKLAVPHLADWCGVDVLEDGKLVPLAVAHVDPAKIELARELRARYPTNPNAQTGAPNVVRTGRSEIYPEVPDELLVKGCVDAEHLRISRELGLKSAIVVPLLARGRALGALTLVAAESGRRYDAEDLALAEDLGRRAGLAMENSMLYREAMQAINVRDDFMSVAGHELKTPLSGALLQLQLLMRMTKGDFDPARLEERAEKAARNLMRLNVLINELLDVSRITAGRLNLDLEEVDLAAIVRETLGRHSDELARAECETQLTIDEPVMARCDRVRIEQVFANLLTNAVKYGKGKPIAIHLAASGGLARLTVRDHGIGIAPEDQARVFERFERAVSNRQFGGLGLGLWIARQIVEAHGGTIRVDSTPGEGAIFGVDLPAFARSAP